MIPAFGRLGPVAAFAVVFLLSGCGTQQQGSPQFVQAFGAVDSPCAMGAPASNAVQHCIAHVVLENKGGEGYGHVTMIVQLQAAKTGSAPVSPVRCGASIPDTPDGGYADLVCTFDLAAGQSVTGYPILQSIDYVGSSSSGSSGSDWSAIATLVLAAATVLLAIASLVAIAGRRPMAAGVAVIPSSSPASAATSGSPRAMQQPERRSDRAAGRDAEYDLPPLPR